MQQSVCTPRSLVSRLLHSGMWTLRLRMWREPGIFSHVSTAKGRTEVEPLNCTWAYPKTQNRKKSKDSRQLTIRIWLWVNVIHTDCWMHSWLNNPQNIAFLFYKLWSYFNYVMITWEKIAGSPRAYSCSGGAWEQSYTPHFLGVRSLSKPGLTS